MKKLSQTQFQNKLLNIMDQKNHWAWAHFSGPSMNKAKLKVHYQQEYAVYVRDFPVFLARIHGHNPPLEVRSMLAENIYEEDTGKLSLGASHPKLFIKMMQGLGYRAREFENIGLLPATRRYRTWLDLISKHPDWIIGAAVLTIFVEGSVNDRQEIQNSSHSKTRGQIQHKINHHPLVQYHGVSREAMDLIRAHQMVEGGHRHDGYAMVINHARDRSQQEAVLKAMVKSLHLWRRYRDGVARACALTPHG